MKQGWIKAAWLVVAAVGVAGCSRGNPAFDDVVVASDGATTRPTTGASDDDAGSQTSDDGPGSATTPETGDPTLPTATTAVDTDPPPVTSDTGQPEPFLLDACCVPGVGPGCPDPKVEACTCALDPYCCNVQWDGVCASRAVAECNLACPGNCCATSDEAGCLDEAVANQVCATMPSCCDDGWSAACAAEAASSGHCTSSASCCNADAADTPYCDDPAVVVCTCTVDPYCCEVDWDLACVQTAVSDCKLVGCPVTPGPCCSTSVNPGCNDPKVENMVCLGDPSCCANAWDEQCLGAAIGAGACSSNQDCCAASGTPGCNQTGVMSCVCVDLADTYCCSSAWDAVCVAEAEGDCALSCN